MGGPVVLDSNNLDAVIKDATGEGLEPIVLPTDSGKPEKPAEKPAEVESKAEAKSDTDDVEGEDGLTPRQKRDFTKAMQATIAKKHRRQKEAEEAAAEEHNERIEARREVERLARENAELKAKLEPPKPKVEEIPEPKRADFKDDQSYWDALVDYRVDRKLRAQEAEAQERQAAAYQEEIAARVTAQYERASELVPDFKEVTEAVDTNMPNWVLEAIRDSQLFPELWYHLAKTPSDIERIVKMTDGVKVGSPQFVKAAQRQLVELGRIESTLTPFAKAKDQNGKEPSKKDGDEPSTDGRKAEPETGSAPSKPRIAPVIRPLNGGSAPQVQKDEADMSQAEVTAAWARKHGVALTARKRH